MSEFSELIKGRYSCRKYDPSRPVEEEKISAVLEVVRLAPSACNGQPYHVTVATGDTAKQIAKEVTGLGLNGFAKDAPVIMVISERPYVKTAAFGAKLKGNDYRSMDIGIAVAYLTAEATCQGLGTCILGWFDDKAIRKICGVDGAVRLVVTMGYALDEPRAKKRKTIEELSSRI